MSREIVEIAAVFLTETEKAILINDGRNEDENTWVPKSQCEDLPEELIEGEVYDFHMTEWIATEKGLI